MYAEDVQIDEDLLQFRHCLEKDTTTHFIEKSNTVRIAFEEGPCLNFNSTTDSLRLKSLSGINHHRSIGLAKASILFSLTGILVGLLALPEFGFLLAFVALVLAISAIATAPRPIEEMLGYLIIVANVLAVLSF